MALNGFFRQNSMLYTQHDESLKNKSMIMNCSLLKYWEEMSKFKAWLLMSEDQLQAIAAQAS